MHATDTFMASPSHGSEVPPERKSHLLAEPADVKQSASTSQAIYSHAIRATDLASQSCGVADSQRNVPVCCKLTTPEIMTIDMPVTGCRISERCGCLLQMLSPGRGEQIKGDFASAAKVGKLRLEANSTVNLKGVFFRVSAVLPHMPQAMS